MWEILTSISEKYLKKRIELLLAQLIFSWWSNFIQLCVSGLWSIVECFYDSLSHFEICCSFWLINIFPPKVSTLWSQTSLISYVNHTYRDGGAKLLKNNAIMLGWTSSINCLRHSHRMLEEKSRKNNTPSSASLKRFILHSSITVTQKKYSYRQEYFKSVNKERSTFPSSNKMWCRCLRFEIPIWNLQWRC
jgi:hypothetical protein